MSAIRTLDLHHLGDANVICCYAVDDVIVDPGPESTRDTLLAQLEAPPRAILLTHIHLDHAAATGALVREWPDVEVWVHERGARHLIDPSKLLASAERLYGDYLETLWGRILPVPEANVRVLHGGEERDGFAVEYTPGHAVHHVSYLHRATGTAFVGDVGGVKIGTGPVLPPTPPPDIDLDAWERSLQAIEAWEPAALGVTHFGLHHDPTAEIAELRDRLARWATQSQEQDAETFAAAVAAETRAAVADDAAAHHYARTLPPSHLHAGLARAHATRA